MLFWNHWNQESAGVAHRPVMFTSTFLGKNPLTRQTRRTFNRSRANLNGPIRNTFIVFCWNQSETILLQGSPELLISLLYMRRRTLGRDWEESCLLEWILIRVEGQIGFEYGYVWTWKILNPERKSCGLKLSGYVRKGPEWTPFHNIILQCYWDRI